MAIGWAVVGKGPDMTIEEASDEIECVQRELTELARTIAGLYDTPAGAAATHHARQREREVLEARLDAARARLVALHLARDAAAYTAVIGALADWQAEKIAAETALREAHKRAATARARVEELAAQERLLREQRQGLRPHLVSYTAATAGRPGLDEARVDLPANVALTGAGAD